ncbi:MAG: ATP-grasp domain-containing protein [Sandaracinaceae bacterium]|nr:ATP-grasp domain-containing protein [Sandaracinaceae bacterium]
MSDPSPYVGIRRLFVANRGEVAARVARTCDALGITPVFGVSEADREAPYTRGREVVVLGRGRASESYLDAPRVVQAAVQARCSALHPGWGFLSENPVFASLCAAHGVTFIGPPPAVMQLMGKKTPAKRAMGLAGLSLIPGSDGILADADDAERVAREVGYPVLLKAESGGGGRGMRIARSESEIRAAFEDASAEALACFADDRVYLEKLIEKGRHVEVQLLADRYGNVVHLGERDCSVQRNHQKLIEESPAPGLSPDELARTLAAAVRACQQIGYVGAGTMEFLLDEGGTLRFMEMNTRLQVEHSVSELRSGVDLVAEQIRVASGHRLSFTQDQIALTGHAIECRINAEDPEQGWKPSPGVLTRFDLPAQVPGAVRVDTHVEVGYEVPPFYDSLLCKVITRGATRDEAADRMIAALSELICEGVPTTTAMHRAVLGSAAFRSNQYDTSGIPGWPASEGR